MKLVSYLSPFLSILCLCACQAEDSKKAAPDAKPATEAKNKESAKTDTTEKKEMKTATIAGGCFWCIEAALERVKGIESVESGYTNGKTKNPTYEEVCSGLTGHTEGVKVTYDPSVITYEQLLRLFFELIDPTQVNAQGPDRGTQYRTGIYYTEESEKAIAQKLIKELTESGKYSKPIATEVEQAATWYPAEAYHQDYFTKHYEAGTGNHGYLCAVAAPKVEKLKKLGVALKEKK
jgi:peptide-methionine (S)-S-oxide reductase